MNGNSTGTTGLALAIVGALVVAASMLPHSFSWLPLAVGVLLLAGGAVLVVAGLRRPEPVLGITPAHISFYQQVRRELPLPQAPPSRAAEETGDLEPMSPEDLEMHTLDAQIREISRKINKATVKLGTGKLSDEGYKRYIEDLKVEKADLEAKRVRIEMARPD